MMHREAPQRRHRIAVLATVAAIHAALIALFLTQHRAPPSPLASTSTIALVAVDAELPAATKPPPPVLPAKIADTFKPLIEISLPAETETDAAAGATGACSPQGAVLDALLIDPDASDAIRQAPAEARSISDAIVIWNEAWNPLAVDISAPLYRVRDIVERTLLRVAPGCLDELVTGPRLLAIPDVSGTRTTIIVVGSGVWTWRALLANESTPGAPLSAAKAKVSAYRP